MKCISSLCLAALAALSFTGGAEAAKKSRGYLPTDAQFKRVLDYYAAVFGHFDADENETEHAAWQAAVVAGEFPIPPLPTFPLPADLPTYDTDDYSRLSRTVLVAVTVALADGTLDLYVNTATTKGFYKVSFRVPGANTGTP
jgi:hypothetical protein